MGPAEPALPLAAQPAGCGRKRASDGPLRLLALLLWLGWAARLGFRLDHAGFPFAASASALAAWLLAGCLWWVAQRQCGQAGAALAVAYYVSSPGSLRPGGPSMAALGLFAMLYTAVGVAHAWQGPRGKRPPRIVLMAALTAFTAGVYAVAAGLGLLLALPAALYLAEGRRRALLPLFLLWGAVAVAAAHLPLRGNGGANILPALLSPAEGLALAGALLLWASRRRSRYFGNSAPLLVFMVFLAASLWVGEQARVWALPFALLFLAGVAADALEGPRARLWAAFFWGLAAVQTLQCFL